MSDFLDIKKVDEVLADKFEQKYAPPAVSLDPFFKLAGTTVFVQLVRDQHVADIANALVVWEWMGAHCTKIEKVRPQKYTITLTAFVKDVMAKLKIRIYLKGDEAHRTYAVELQRCRGDSITVNIVYQKVESFLRGSFKIVNEVGDETGPPPPTIDYSSACFGFISDDHAATNWPIGSEALLPILDMANMISQPSLQAEAAQALVECTEPRGKLDLKAAAALCTDDVFRGLESLLSTRALDVEFFTARLLRNLEKTPEASEFFVKYHLVHLGRLDNFGKVSDEQEEPMSGARNGKFC